MAITEQFILLALGLVTIGVRVFVRWRQVGPSNWQLDDYLMPLVGVSFVTNSSFPLPFFPFKIVSSILPFFLPSSA